MTSERARWTPVLPVRRGPARMAALALAGVLAGACVDPVITLTVEAGAGISDGGVDGGFDIAKCQACYMAPDLPGPGCATEYATCEASGICSAVLTCLTSAGCFGGPASSFLNCGIPCAQDAGIQTRTDPALVPVTKFFECAVNGVCGPECTGP